MPGTTRVEIRTLKVGRYLCVDDQAYKILSISKSKPGKHGSAKARIECTNLFTGQKISHVGSVTTGRVYHCSLNNRICSTPANRN